jgi:hypothetical protein
MPMHPLARGRGVAAKGPVPPVEIDLSEIRRRQAPKKKTEIH